MFDKNNLEAIIDFEKGRQQEAASVSPNVSEELQQTAKRLKENDRPSVPILLADTYKDASFMQQSPQPDAEWRYVADGLRESRAWPLGYREPGIGDLYLTEEGDIATELLGIVKEPWGEGRFWRIFYTTKYFRFYGRVSSGNPEGLVAHLRSHV